MSVAIPGQNIHFKGMLHKTQILMQTSNHSLTLFKGTKILIYGLIN